MEEVLRVEDLSFAYESKSVLRNLNISINKGEKIAVMGCNGAGKSTFFLNLSGVLCPDSGDIFLEGRKLSKGELKKLHKRVGFVFQNADSQIIASNVRAEISFGPMNLKLPRDEVQKRVCTAVNYMDLKGLEERAPQYLSGGEKKRVSIADILA
ncbi:MAG: energy-coupling factor ABC transporter ATP-binding protein, partial [Lachnospiraceae bacterium]|nr:energy-coupling factor ABC transporter ATP-binding protein [Lachnospiraceae bacterium]